jgi:hypothetical protein
MQGKYFFLFLAIELCCCVWSSPCSLAHITYCCKNFVALFWEENCEQGNTVREGLVRELGVEIV